jgi:predicted component of type VI protein secretion system
MDRTTDRFPLAQHTWKSGQLLTPAHFERQEDVLLAHLAARVRLVSPRPHGIVTLQLDAAQLRAGVVAIERLVWLRQDGVLVSTGENAHLPPLLEIEGNGRTPVMLYVSLDDGVDESFDGTEGTALVPRLYRLDIEPLGLTSERTRRAEESCQLLEVARGPDGKELVLGEFVPPLLRVGDSPFLRKQLFGLEQSITQYNRGLLTQIHVASAVQERAADVQRRYVAGQRLLALLREAGLSDKSAVDAASPMPRLPRSPVSLHPYDLFRELRDYACELASTPGSVIDPEFLIYDHDNLKSCFLRVIAAIVAGAPVRSASPKGLEFEREGRLFILRQLPREVLEGRNVVLALNGVDDVSGLKLASPSRLARLHTALLPGLPIEEHRVEHAPVGGVQTRYFRVGCVGEEWQYVQSERALAFQRLAGTGLHATLLWGANHGTA